MTKTVETKIPRLLERYRNQVVPAMADEFKYDNPMQVPRITKVVINMGIKEAGEDPKLLETFSNELTRITGQKPLTTLAKKSISAFKLRQGVPVGLKVTLRRARMYEFLDRLFNVAMPRIRDFRGFPPYSFDDHGNMTVGLQEQTVFPEVEFDKVKRVKGMDITFVTSATTKEEGRRLLELMGLPFRK